MKRSHISKNTSQAQGKLCTKCKKNKAVRGQSICAGCGFYQDHATKNAAAHARGSK